MAAGQQGFHDLANGAQAEGELARSPLAAARDFGIETPSGASPVQDARPQEEGSETQSHNVDPTHAKKVFGRKDFRSMKSVSPWMHHETPFWLTLLLPFLQLKEEASVLPPLRCCRRRRHGSAVAEVFLTSCLFWLIGLTIIMYLLLLITEVTFLVQEKNGAYLPVIKSPGVGDHYSYLLLTKRIMELLLMHYLCRIMEPNKAARREHYRHLELAEPVGVLTDTSRLCRRLIGRQLGPRKPLRWFSSFITDHLLLGTVGTSYIIYVVMSLIEHLSVKNMQVEQKLYMANVSSDSFEVLIVEAVVSIYVAVLVVGFLVITLGHNVVPKKERQSEFVGVLALFIIVWASNFLVVLLDRQIYTSLWVTRKQICPWRRLVAALGQVFITHSTVMLGAVFFGHSEHFTPCPDLEWSTLFRKVLPMVVMTGIFGAWSILAQDFSSHQSCARVLFNVFSASWPYVFVTLEVLGGLLLIYLAVADGPTSLLARGKASASLDSLLAELDLLPAPEQGGHPAVVLEEGHSGHGHDSAGEHSQEEHRNEQHQHHSEGRRHDEEQHHFEEQHGQEVHRRHGTHFPHAHGHGPRAGMSVSDMLDYDSWLVVITILAALSYYVVTIFASGLFSVPYTFFSRVAELLAPLGIATFTVSAWRKPPKRNTRSSLGLWYAMFMASLMFISFSKKEDCALTSDHPACCNYPWLPDYNKKYESKCNLDLRCSDASYDKVTGLYCGYKGGKKASGTEEAAEGNATSVAGEAAGSRHLGAAVTSVVVDAEHCESYKERWTAFATPNAQGTCPALEETLEYSDGQSVAYKLFSTVGKAAAVECYFTIFGVLLKTMFLSQHPNSHRILAIGSHGH